MLNIKKVGFVISVGLALLFSGCSSKSIQNETVDDRCRTLTGTLAPNWVCNNLEIEGAVLSVGSATANLGNNPSHQRDMAKGNGRDELAKQIATKTKNLLETYSETTSSSYDSSSLRVSRQIANETISNSRLMKRWIDQKDKTMYVLMAVSTSQIKNKLKHNIKSSYGNKSAAYQRFLASEAQGKLDRELEKIK